jgi:hypothetical protein
MSLPTNKKGIQQKEKTVINFYMPNVSASDFIKHVQIDLKTQIDPTQ